MKFRLVEDQRDTFPVRVVCDVMGVSPAGYYAWRGRPESPRKVANRALLTEIYASGFRSPPPEFAAAAAAIEGLSR